MNKELCKLPSERHGRLQGTLRWILKWGREMKKKVIRIGFEPMTYSLEGCRSIQLSYRTVHDVLS